MHLRKVPTLLSVYDALQMALELRESLIQALPNPTEYQNELGRPDRILSPITISFSDKEKCANVPDNNRPLSISSVIDEKEILWLWPVMDRWCEYLAQPHSPT